MYSCRTVYKLLYLRVEVTQLEVTPSQASCLQPSIHLCPIQEYLFNFLIWHWKQPKGQGNIKNTSKELAENDGKRHKFLFLLDIQEDSMLCEKFECCITNNLTMLLRTETIVIKKSLLHISRLLLEGFWPKSLLS